ncbi:hypothetical protein HJC23_006081 [Cyclotella cryptica]|uniref:Uncharacterized protein n=1 Tax=Cyclotella cryptica TaxID=29204 RepID=A0ABD3QJH0_9STRA|eukprot:CCRYP_004540-RA/>CCRYP_004540-RA protein AED:0.01 eAED:0.01 QI:604/1/1/1/0/0/2/128/327
MALFDRGAFFAASQRETILSLALHIISYSHTNQSLMNADLALSVTMTTVSTILSMGFLPMNLYIYSYAAYHGVETSDGENVLASIDFGGIFLSICIVIAAIGTGIFCSWKFDSPQWHKVAYLGGNISGIALIVWSTFLSFYPFDNQIPTPDEVITSDQKTHYFAIGLPCLLGLVAASVLCTAIRLPRPERLTTAVECCYQNTGIATSAAFSLFSSDPEQLSQAMRVPVIYGLVEAVAIGLYLLVFWKLGWSKAPSDENFCTVITKSYELRHDDKEGDEAVDIDVYAEEAGSDDFRDQDDQTSEMTGVATNNNDNRPNEEGIEERLVL